MKNEELRMKNVFYIAYWMSIFHSSFYILHSSFYILHSSFFIFHSSFSRFMSSDGGISLYGCSTFLEVQAFQDGVLAEALLDG